MSPHKRRHDDSSSDGRSPSPKPSKRKRRHDREKEPREREERLREREERPREREERPREREEKPREREERIRERDERWREERAREREERAREREERPREREERPREREERPREREDRPQEREERPSPSPPPAPVVEKQSAELPLSKMKIATVNMRTGGAYIPPAKLKMMQEQISDKGSIEYQRIAWEALKKSLTGLTNKVTVENIGIVVQEIFKENIIRGRGVLARAVMQAQAASPTFTHVYASLVAIINSRFPLIGELILKRLIIQFKRSFRRNDKNLCVPTIRFLGHLLNQAVAHEVLILEILCVLLESASDASVEIAIALIKECGQKMTKLASRGTTAIYDRLRHLSNERQLDTRTQYMIEALVQIRKDGYKDFQSVIKELDLVEENDQNTHMLTLDDAVDTEDLLNVFKFDPEYLKNEEKYKDIEKEILESGSEDSGSSGEGSESEEEEEEEEKTEESQKITDMTETNLVALRRNIYLTIQSSLDFEECSHKLLKLELNQGQIVEMCYMILDCCAQQRTYEKFFGLLAQRFCQLNKIYIEPFTDIFKVSYETIHRFETNKLRNVAKFFAHLLYTDAISWLVLACIKLNEDDTTSSSRIFIKILFQELCEYMGLKKLNDRIKDVTLQEAFDGLFPRDNPRNTRFAINFFTSIGLGGLTDELREHLKSAPKPVIPALTEVDVSSSSDDEDDSSSDSDSDDSSSSKEKKKAKASKKKKKKTSQRKKSKKKHSKKSKKHKS